MWHLKRSLIFEFAFPSNVLGHFGHLTPSYDMVFLDCGESLTEIFSAVSFVDSEVLSVDSEAAHRSEFVGFVIGSFHFLLVCWNLATLEKASFLASVFVTFVTSVFLRPLMTS